ncbi:hypothetical protein ACFLSA_04805 [Bacteroidota bacterium]
MKRIILSARLKRRVILFSIFIALFLPHLAYGQVEINENKALVVDGELFFPFGFWAVQKDELQEVAEAGCNTVLTTFSLPRSQEYYTADGMIDYMNEAEKQGLKIMLWWEMFALDLPGDIVTPNIINTEWVVQYSYHRDYHAIQDPEKYGQYAHRTDEYMDALLEHHLQAFKQGILKIKDHRALLGYSGMDEPSSTIKDRPACKRIYDTAHLYDPNHPLWLMFSSRIKWVDNNDCDMLGIDKYWKPDQGETPLVVANAIDAAIARANEVNKPFIFVPQYSNWSGSPQELTPSEQRCQLYVAVIHGGKRNFNLEL